MSCSKNIINNDISNNHVNGTNSTNNTNVHISTNNTNNTNGHISTNSTNSKNNTISASRHINVNNTNNNNSNNEDINANSSNINNSTNGDINSNDTNSVTNVANATNNSNNSITNTNTNAINTNNSSKIDSIIIEDIENICNELQDVLKKLEGSTWLISGGGGFIGGYFLDILSYCNKVLFTKPCRIICLDNFISGIPERISHLKKDRNFHMCDKNVVKPIKIHGKIDYVVHAASIASPTYYRKYPLETIETNVLGLINLLELARKKKAKSFLSFSTSEIYGDPPAEWIPTPENYNGNVSCTGPRACYDESKRLGETLCTAYYRQYKIPIKVVRPFNVFGPGLRIDDKRVIPDFFNNALSGKKIQLLSSGSPTRSFCYISDAMCGFMKAILSDFNGEAFNIGNDQIEISMLDLAKKVAEMSGGVGVEYKISDDKDYLIDNPQRRCPDLTKAKKLLGYHPKVGLEEGLRKMLEWYKRNYSF